MNAPTDLVDLGYGRGQLRAAPAQSIFRLDAKIGRPVDSNSAYRDYNEQMKAYRAYRAYRNGTGPWAPLALHPDSSWHCKGMALDTDDGPNYNRGISRQMWRDNGWLFEVATEDWHGQYYANLDKFAGQPAGGGGLPLPIPQVRRLDMRLIMINFPPSQRCLALVGTRYFQQLNQTQANDLVPVWGAVENVSFATWDQAWNTSGGSGPGPRKPI